MRSEDDSGEFVPDVSLDQFSGKMTGRPESLAFLIHSGVMQYDQVIPRLAEDLRQDVLARLGKLTKSP